MNWTFSTLTATISAYPSEPPRNVVTDLFSPWMQKHDDYYVCRLFRIQHSIPATKESWKPRTSKKQETEQPLGMEEKMWAVCSCCDREQWKIVEIRYCDADIIPLWMPTFWLHCVLLLNSWLKSHTNPTHSAVRSQICTGSWKRRTQFYVFSIFGADCLFLLLPTSLLARRTVGVCQHGNRQWQWATERPQHATASAGQKEWPEPRHTRPTER